MSETEAMTIDDLHWDVPDGEGVALLITDPIAAQAIFDVIHAAGDRETDQGLHETAGQLQIAIDEAWPEFKEHL